MKNWDRMTMVNEYLESNKTKGINAFKELIAKAKRNTAELVVLSFTYENIEAYVKINGKFELYNNLFAVLSQSVLDELTSYDYDDENRFEDYQYWKFNGLAWGLIEMWMVDCFEEATKDEIPGDLKFYFKQNHDSMQILELNSCVKYLEKSEFEVYVKNNQRNLMGLLGEED